MMASLAAYSGMTFLVGGEADHISMVEMIAVSASSVERELHNTGLCAVYIGSVDSPNVGFVMDRF